MTYASVTGNRNNIARMAPVSQVGSPSKPSPPLIKTLTKIKRNGARLTSVPTCNSLSLRLASAFEVVNAL